MLRPAVAAREQCVLAGERLRDLTGFSWTNLIEIISLERKPEDAEEATHR